MSEWLKEHAEETQSLEAYYALIEGTSSSGPVSWWADYDSLYRGENIAGGRYVTDEPLTEAEYYEYDGQDFADSSEVNLGSLCVSEESEDGDKRYLNIPCDDTGQISREIHKQALRVNYSYAGSLFAHCMVNKFPGGVRARLGKCAGWVAFELSRQVLRNEAVLWANYLYACFSRL